MLAFAAVSAYVLFESEDDPDRIARAQFTAAVEQLKPGVKSGNGPALIAMGDLLRDTPVDHGGDPGRAAAYYQIAAKDGFATAQARLGALYANGIGVPRDLGRAFDLFRVSAQLGHNVDAEFALAEMYYTGQGVLQDYGRAVDWYQKAARGGHPVAQFLVGRMYRDGWGVDADIMESFIWFSLAAENAATVRAADQSFRVIKERDDVQVVLNAFQIREAARRADARRVSR